MKIFIYLLALFALSTAHANNIIVNGTRFIYSEDSAEITIQMTNTGNYPSLAQVWLDEGNPEKLPEEISTPFIISPPIARVDAGNGQSLRIKKQLIKILSPPTVSLCGGLTYWIFLPWIRIASRTIQLCSI